MSSTTNISSTTTTTTTSNSNTGRLRRRRVCLFGTSANPPTGVGGHVGIVHALATNIGRDAAVGGGDLDEIRIIPVYHHPFSKKRNDMVSYQHRLNMCRLAFQNLDTSCDGVLITVSDAEERCFQQFFKDKQDNNTRVVVFDQRVGTSDLLDMLCQEEPDIDFSFCLGADTFLDLMAGKWKRSRDVIQMLHGRLWIIPRLAAVDAAVAVDVNGSNDGGDDDHYSRTEQLLMLQQRIDELNAQEGCSNGGARLLTVPTLRPISSTMVRNCENLAELETLLVPSVLAYIQENHLYAFQQSDDGTGTVKEDVL